MTCQATNAKSGKYHYKILFVHNKTVFRKNCISI